MFMPSTTIENPSTAVIEDNQLAFIPTIMGIPNFLKFSYIHRLDTSFLFLLLFIRAFTTMRKTKCFFSFIRDTFPFLIIEFEGSPFGGGYHLVNGIKGFVAPVSHVRIFLHVITTLSYLVYNS
jgi:hypothetical protein